MYTGKVRASSIYKEYPAPDTSVQSSEEIPKKILALDQVVSLVCHIESQLETMQSATQDDATVLSVLKQPKRAGLLRLSAVTMRSYVSELDMVLKQKSKLGDLKQDLVAPVLAQMINDSDSITQLIDNALVYPPTSVARKHKFLANIRTRMINLVKNVSIIKSVFGELRASLILDQRLAGSRPDRPARTSALFDDGPDINTVLEGFKNRGWNVNLRKNDGEPDEESDGYRLSLALIERVKKPVTALLRNDVTIGVVRFPVIARVRSKLSDRMIHKCIDPKIGYSLYFVFGGYITIDNAIAIGINRDILSIRDTKGKVVLDTDKFVALLPYAKKTFPEWEEPLQHVRPVHPAKLKGSHYYMLLMPEGTMGESRHSISDWSFLSC